MLLEATLMSVLSVVVGDYNATFIASITNLLDNLLVNYDNKIRPEIGGKPLLVTVHMSVLNIGPVSEKDMEFTMDCYFRNGRQSYLHTLTVPNVLLRVNTDGMVYVSQRNGRQSYLHTLTVPNVLLRVNTDGMVYVSQRLTIRTRCPMYLKKFPMDTQVCPVVLGSLGYSTKDVVYKWKKVSLNPKIDLSQYKIKRHFTHERNISDPRHGLQAEPPLSTLEAYFELQRQQGFYVLQIYTPCSLIVVMSWVSFWINKEASPARVGLGVMTVLTMSTLGLGGRDDLPKVTYSTALDIYIVACFGFVFASLVEYAFINFAYMLLVNKRREELRDRERMSGGGSFDSIEYPRRRRKLFAPPPARLPNSSYSAPSSLLTTAPEDNSWETFVQKLHNVGLIDTAAKILFPLSYTIFNALYWMAFLYWIPDEIYEHLDVPLSSYSS